ncbi:unnamed protein product [Clavelina lepadiformis]|uniref:Uncharacterized protein n=1 Tax=Clavelina lepadiformis TaxID=159417 RepID=A0ABP0FHN4_CLALP
MDYGQVKHSNRAISSKSGRESPVLENAPAVPPRTEASNVYTEGPVPRAFDRQIKHIAPVPLQRYSQSLKAPTLPPKKSSRTGSLISNDKQHLLEKSLSVNNCMNRYQRTSSPDEELYISAKDIETIPEEYTKSQISQRKPRPAPPISGIRQRLPLHIDNTATSPKPPRAENMYSAGAKRPDFDFMRPRSPNPVNVGPPEWPINDSAARSYSSVETSNFIPVSETAIYGAAQGKSGNLVMALDRINIKLNKLYKKIEQYHPDSVELIELKKHLRLSEHENAAKVMERIHKTLTPPLTTELSNERRQSEELYVINFVNFESKHDLRQQIINMFAKPGPPSISYSKVDAKMDQIITEFCARVESLRNIENRYVKSAAHARAIMKGFGDHESFIKALHENKLWIKWGTPSGLPPIPHLYMHKQPPSYEVRKAVTISSIAERLRAMPNMFNLPLSTSSLCPPIYSRLKTDILGEIKWQVTEYNHSTGKFENHECQFPSWLDEDQSVISLLRSSNRTVFKQGDHPYELYAIYLVVIKDFTIVQDLSEYPFDSECATPSKFQYYIGSSTTGVLFRFTCLEESHCKRTKRILQEASTLSNYRCYDGCDLVEACLALSWIRRQPRAIFVLNSFLSARQSSLSLEKKKPFNEKMLSMEKHLIEGKKIGPLFNMRFGMNGTTTVKDPYD